MSLRDDEQQNIQIERAFSSALTGEAREAGREESESSAATSGTENPAGTNRLMEGVCEREKLKAALRQVKANKASPGVDGMTVGGIKDSLKRHWPAIREQLLNGTYEPKPVRGVEIPKPDGGGARKLGIPSVLDRFIQQAVMQVLQRRWDRTFSDHSYGFRPGRSAHHAVAQAQQYIAEGHGWCVDLDLVNHDNLMESITRFITQRLKLKVNEAKSAVARPQERKFLGFSFAAGPEVKRVIAPKAVDRFKQRIREITRRAKGVSIGTTIEELAPYLRGRRSYFGFCETPEVLIGLTRWVRLRLRADLWRQWKTPRRRRAALLKLGVRPGWQATPLATGLALGTSRRPRPSLWGFLMRTSNRSNFRHCSRNVSVTDSNRRVRTRTHGGVAGVGG